MPSDARRRYEALYRRSLDEPESFWLEAAYKLDWTEPPTRAFVSVAHPGASHE